MFKMKLSEFRIELPSSLIALHPAKNRDESRLMIVHRDSGEIEHKIFKDIVEYFDHGDVLVVNDTKVFSARLFGNKEKTGAKIEVFLLRELNKDMHLWDVLVDPARKIRVGNKLYFGEGELVAEVIDNTTSRGRTIRFLFDDKEQDFYSLVDRLGEIPLPKEINRSADDSDKERFQTIFADKLGAVASPTAGLHFTQQLVKKLSIADIEISPITLHVGLGTFRSVEVEDLTKHKMDSENFFVPYETEVRVNKAMEEKKKVCAVGCSALRSLESSVSANNKLKENSGWTDKFIFPPYEFKICNAMLTNFHLPESTLLMTAAAFGGHKLIRKAYEIAMKKKYRFFAYGDAMLII